MYIQSVITSTSELLVPVDLLVSGGVCHRGQHLLRLWRARRLRQLQVVAHEVVVGHVHLPIFLHRGVLKHQRCDTYVKVVSLAG